MSEEVLSQLVRLGQQAEAAAVRLSQHADRKHDQESRRLAGEAWRAFEVRWEAVRSYADARSSERSGDAEESATDQGGVRAGANVASSAETAFWRAADPAPVGMPPVISAACPPSSAPAARVAHEPFRTARAHAQEGALPRLSVSVVQQPGEGGEVTVVYVDGSLTADAGRDLRKRLLSLQHPGLQQVLLDLSAVTAIDPAGLGVLVWAVRRAELDMPPIRLSLVDAGGEVSAVAHSSGLAQVLRLNGI